jgi:pyrroline-5-carboxylate reductase
VVDRQERVGAVMHFVYIVRCADGTLYTGCAKDLAARVSAHNGARGAKYTRSRLPVTLVYKERCRSLGVALRREHEIKQLTRQEKDALVARGRRGTRGRVLFFAGHARGK